MKGCISTHTLMIYRFVSFNMRSVFISGWVCVRGGAFVMSLISFFCVLISGWVYVFFISSVSHSVIAHMRCGSTRGRTRV